MSALVDNLPALLAGLGTTLFVLVTSAVGALVLGTLVVVARVSPVPVLRAAAFGYVQVLVNVPLLALLLLAVFALPDAGLIAPLVTTAIVVLTVYEAAYVAEALRSGINTVPKGQVEAARALGFTLSQTLRMVVVPQAARAVVQPLGNVLIALLMNTALTATVGVVELTSATNKVNLVQAEPITIFGAAGLVYMALALVIGLGAGRIEKKVAIRR
ncbi:glutamate transport system permease protein [Klenkia marina]|uniref:Glutamate transport system permease protein n=1 Tax=Klenkia marina TaxID=1960309 RepID=A0A1G4Y826_9ACTN|nr:amino acid ABC transporter permease [Klenkia marina]SCX49539.1 glutamate transport system permease protein [Klenkia marina]